MLGCLFSMVSNAPQTARPFLGIEIGGTKLQMVVGRHDTGIVHRRRFSVEAGRGAQSIRENIAGALPGILSEWVPAAVGVGYGGPVNWRTGQIVKSYHVPGWHEFPLGDWLSGLAGIPVFVENDGNTAAYGEAVAGAGRGADPVFYTTIGSGVGGGLVHAGAIYHGYTGGEAEVGHLRFGTGGQITESFCSGWSIDRRIREAVEAGGRGVLAELVAGDPGNEARHLGAALAVGDAFAVQVLEEAAGQLAVALSHVVHLFHPEVLILGGGVSLIGEPWRSAVERRLGGLVMDAFLPAPRLVLSALREDAVPVGALALAAQRSGCVSPN